MVVCKGIFRLRGVPPGSHVEWRKWRHFSAPGAALDRSVRWKHACQSGPFTLTCRIVSSSNTWSQSPLDCKSNGDHVPSLLECDIAAMSSKPGSGFTSFSPSVIGDQYSSSCSTDGISFLARYMLPDCNSWTTGSRSKTRPARLNRAGSRN